MGWVILVVGGFVVALLVGVAVQRINAVRFPKLPFTLDDLSEVAGYVEAAKARLAPGDYVAFAITAELPGVDVEGQVWYFAAKASGRGKTSIERTSIELSYDWPADPEAHPALRPLLEQGWQVTSWERDSWVLLSRLEDIEGDMALRFVTATLAGLQRLDPSARWSLRGFA